MSLVIDLTGVNVATLTFWHRYGFARDDEGSVWVARQRKGGSWWAEEHLRTILGTQPTWT